MSCSICLDVFDCVNQNKVPKILPCQHTYCVECLRTLMHCSNDHSFNCPQCKFKVENVADVGLLPTSRIVQNLLVNDSFNYQGYASCPGCRQIRNLEVCFECNLPLCQQVCFFFSLYFCRKIYSYFTKTNFEVYRQTF